MKTGTHTQVPHDYGRNATRFREKSVICLKMSIKRGNNSPKSTSLAWIFLQIPHIKVSDYTFF